MNEEKVDHRGAGSVPSASARQSRTNIPALLVALGSALCAILAFTLLRMREPTDLLLVDRPDWMTRPPTTATGSESPIQVGDPQLRATDAASQSEDDLRVVRAMVPPSELAAALQESAQRVQFKATALIDSGLAAEMADGFVKAAERCWDAQLHYISHDIRNHLRASGDFFFALWPSLGERIRSKEILPRIVAIPADSLVPRYSVISIYHGNQDPRQHYLTFTLNSDKWQMQLRFDAETNPYPELFSQITYCYERDRFKQGPR